MLKSLLLFLPKTFKTNTQLKLEILVLTKQIEILHSSNPKLKVKRFDRIFFGLMMYLLSNWKERMFIVKPQTVIKWHRTDRDIKYGTLLGGKKNSIGIDEIVTAYRLPWQNGYIERVIGIIKRECLDHLIILNENHLRSILTDYFYYYNKYRTHLGLNKDSPEGRPVQSEGEIYKVLAVNGLHNIYFRQAA